MSALAIPQIALVMDPAAAGGAYVPAMADETVIVRNQDDFPRWATAGQSRNGRGSHCRRIGGAEIHTKISGVADHLAEDDLDALRITREIISNLNRQKPTPHFLKTPRDPLYDAENIYGLIPENPQKSYDVRDIIACIVDGSEFEEFKKNYGTTLVCGFAHLWGMPVGNWRNNGILFSNQPLKASLIQSCCQRKIPLIFLHQWFYGGSKNTKMAALQKMGQSLSQPLLVLSKSTLIIGGKLEPVIMACVGAPIALVFYGCGPIHGSPHLRR